MTATHRAITEVARNGDAARTEPAWEGAPSEIQNRGPAFHARTYLIDRIFRRLRPHLLLDIGCGRGYVTAVAARHARRVVATDVAPGAARATRELLSAHPNAGVVVADVLARGEAGAWGRGAAFDAILLSEVLEHLEDDRAALRTCRDLLAEGGCLVLTVPSDPSLWTRWDDLAGHRRRYTRRELVRKVDAAGFRVRQVINWGFPVTGWLAVRGARMRSRRVLEGSPGGEVPSAIARLLPVGSLFFKLAARIEPLFSSLDRGAGYVVVAERLPAGAQQEHVLDEAA